MLTAASNTSAFTRIINGLETSWPGLVTTMAVSGVGDAEVVGDAGLTRRVPPSISASPDGQGGSVSEERRTIVFFPEGAFGPTNNCVGIGNVLRARGHRVVFIAEESFAGTLEARGFEEALMRLQPPPADEEDPGQFW
ncbi:MAG: hypothetical protein ACRDH0_08140, partial [Actinomycetota bacterium]